MTIDEIEYLMSTIDAAIERGELYTKTVREDEGFTGNNANWLKTHVMAEVFGNLAGELLFLKGQLDKERKALASKKFYQFWK